MSRHATNIKPVEDKRFLAIGMFLFAVLMFTGIDSSAKWLALSGMPAMEIVFSRYLVHVLFVLVFLLPFERDRGALFHSNNVPLEVLRALILLGATISNFIAVKYLPLTVTGSIVFAMPLILTALSGPFLGEHVGWRRWLAIMIGFSGVLIIIRPGGADFHWAMLLSLSSTIFYAFYNILTRKLAGVDSSFTQQIYSSTIAMICVTPFAFAGWVWPADVAGWVAFVGMGIFGGIGHLLVSIAHRLAPASTLAPFIYPQIIFMSLASWFVFSQAPDISIFIGAPIVVASGLYIWLREKQLARKS